MNVAARHNAANDITTKVTSRATALRTMRAMVQSVYGPPDVLLLRTIARPTLRAADVLVRAFIEAGTLRPVIDQTFPLQETPAALRHIETGHARGKVVITVT